MPRFCSSIPQHLGPLVWAPRSLVTRRVALRSLVTRRVALRSLVTRRVALRSLITRRVALRTLVARVALRSLVTTVLLRQGQQTQLGGRRLGSWQPVAVLLTEAGLPLCPSQLDPLQLSHQCLNLWEVLSPDRHISPAVWGKRKERALCIRDCFVLC